MDRNLVIGGLMFAFTIFALAYVLIRVILHERGIWPIEYEAPDDQVGY